MAKHTKCGRAQDRRRVAGGQDWEVLYGGQEDRQDQKRRETRREKRLALAARRSNEH